MTHRLKVFIKSEMFGSVPCHHVNHVALSLTRSPASKQTQDVLPLNEMTPGDPNSRHKDVISERCSTVDSQNSCFAGVITASYMPFLHVTFFDILPRCNVVGQAGLWKVPGVGGVELDFHSSCLHLWILRLQISTFSTNEHTPSPTLLENETAPCPTVSHTFWRELWGPLNYNPVERYFFDRVSRGRPVCVPYGGKYITQLGHCEDLADFMAKCVGNGVPWMI